MAEYSNDGSKTKGIIIMVVAVLVVVVGGWYWFMYKPAQEAAEKARQEQIRLEAARKERAKRAAEKKAEFDDLIVRADGEYNAENWGTANSLYAEASALYPKESYPKDQLALVKVKLDELAAIAARKAAGVVETVSSATGRYYVIVSSSIDDDLAKDYAKKLAEEGNNAKIIEPIENKRFYRVSLGDYDTRAQAESASNSLGNAWVLKY